MFQVTEVQTATTLPHAHGLHWTSLSQNDSAVLEILQADGDCHLLGPGEVASLCKIGHAAITVSLDPATLQRDHPYLSKEEASQVSQLAKYLQVHKRSNRCTAKTPPGEDCSTLSHQASTLALPSGPSSRSKEDRIFLKQVQEILIGIKQQLSGEQRNGQVYPAD